MKKELDIIIKISTTINFQHITIKMLDVTFSWLCPWS